jgi:hypothetical protein
MHREAPLHRGIGRREVRVIGSADNDRIQFPGVSIEQPPEILVAPGRRKCLETERAGIVVHVRDRHHVVIPAVVECGLGNPAAADQGDVEPGIRRRARLADAEPWQSDARQRGGL